MGTQDIGERRGGDDRDVDRAEVMTLRLLGNIGDFVSLSVIGATLTSILPPLAAGAAFFYTGIRIYEYVRWVKRGRQPRDRY